MTGVDRADRAGVTTVTTAHADRLPSAPEDGVVLLVLVLAIVFVMFMASLPLWFSRLIHVLAT